MTICPNTLQVLKVSNGTRPVIQVADVAVNRASMYDTLLSFVLIGSDNSNEPISIIAAKPIATIFG